MNLEMYTNCMHEGNVYDIIWTGYCQYYIISVKE